MAKKRLAFLIVTLSLTLSACSLAMPTNTVQISELPEEDVIVETGQDLEDLPEGVVYTKEEWFSKGYLDIPFDYEDMKYYDIKENAQMSPQTIEEASTEELLSVVEELSPSPEIYDKVTYFRDEIERSFNCFSALCSRGDISQVALEKYEEYGIVPLYSASSNMSKTSYEHLAIREDVKRRLLELILAMDSSFTSMSDEERQLTLQLMSDYAKQRAGSKCYNVANVVSSMFFAYIAEMVNDGNGSLWADYILDLGADAPAYQFYQKAVDNTIGWVMFDYE